MDSTGTLGAPLHCGLSTAPTFFAVPRCSALVLGARCGLCSGVAAGSLDTGFFLQCGAPSSTFATAQHWHDPLRELGAHDALDVR